MSSFVVFKLVCPLKMDSNFSLSFATPPKTFSGRNEGFPINPFT